MVRKYVRRCDYHPGTEKLRELLSKVTDEQKLNILQQTKDGSKTALNVAADRDDAEMITTILSSIQSSYRPKLLMMRGFRQLAPLHKAASEGHTESVKAILDSLTADQQMQLLIVEEDWCCKTAVEMASGETADVLSEYKNRAKEKADPGEFIPLNSHVL